MGPQKNKWWKKNRIRFFFLVFSLNFFNDGKFYLTNSHFFALKIVSFFHNKLFSKYFISTVPPNQILETVIFSIFISLISLHFKGFDFFQWKLIFKIIETGILSFFYFCRFSFERKFFTWILQLLIYRSSENIFILILLKDKRNTSNKILNTKKI